jgi:anti-sigma factor RsiW
MPTEQPHLSDQELLLAVDGELSESDAGRVQSHLAACGACRARQQEMEASLGEFVRLQRTSLDPQIPPADGSRALLKAQLARMADSESIPWWSAVPWRLSWAGAAAAFGLVAMALLFAHAWSGRQGTHMVAVMVPNPSLTPGATVLVGREEVCMESNTKNKTVPVALQRRVFDEYGIRSAAPSAYEVDYLITPALGGADDIHNLWPQTYTETVWNAQVKDALEDHLRDLVCDGQLDLATAQREIATNWIAAYKKYFHTDLPLTRYRQ